MAIEHRSGQSGSLTDVDRNSVLHARPGATETAEPDAAPDSVRATGQVQDENGRCYFIDVTLDLPNSIKTWMKGPWPIILVPQFRNFVRRLIQAVLIAVVAYAFTYAVKNLF